VDRYRLCLELVVMLGWWRGMVVSVWVGYLWIGAGRDGGCVEVVVLLTENVKVVVMDYWQCW
jgi:hypothetical protein